ncbi:MAG: hypothetical protein AAF928_16385 [Myxococcota bacterium]
MRAGWWWVLVAGYGGAMACGGRTLDGDLVPFGASANDDAEGGAAGVGGRSDDDDDDDDDDEDRGDDDDEEEEEGPMPVACLACIGLECPQTLDCVTDPACIEGIGCVVEDCLDGGAPDVLCVADCFEGDQDAALTALGVLGCITGECGEDCEGTLPLP